ncbi:MAG TPA: zinc-binding dehydrogenase [Acidimicrobiales bacterium]|nr:zinc-binding dehydrogenase [Acidimicrobiales bacterium]
MLAVVISNHRLVLEERPTPEPGVHDVVVAVRSAGVNAADLLQLKGYYPAPPGWPADIPGLELAGIVVSVGTRVHEPLLGRRVCAVVGGGAQATHCLVPSEHLLFVPDHVTWDEAGGFAEAFTTAHDALVTQGGVESGQRVLISGAAGGVGVAAVQIAHSLGAHVIAVTRSDEHHARLRELGADETITMEDVVDIAPVDIVLELVGAAHLTLAWPRLAPYARVVVIGVGGGSRMEIDLLSVMSTRMTLTGSTLRARSRSEKSSVADRVAQTMIPRWRTGEVRVPVAQTFALDDADLAYAAFEQQGKFGKIVLRTAT